MQIKGLLWLDEIVDKLHYKHSVSQIEVQEIFNSKLKFRFVEKGHRPGENVYFAQGRTEPGRYLIVFFIYNLLSAPKKAVLIINMGGIDMYAPTYAGTRI